MKLRHIFWALSAIVAVVAMAAGVAVLVNKYLTRNNEVGYIECECDSDPDPILDEEEAN